MLDAGRIDEPVPGWQLFELRVLVKSLREERERRNLSLTDVSMRSGLTRGMISQLENGWNSNPTLATRYKYALAIGMYIKLTSTAAEVESLEAKGPAEFPVSGRGIMEPPPCPAE